MVDTAIKVENLAKRYRINTLRNQDTLASQIKTLLTPWSNSADENSDQDYVWALNDLNFTVNRGEVVAIIGKNGSGKSTLLKLISRIIRPTRGRIELHGRVASLLEVGTGFHPELSGRENVFMNGAILGMSREEIRKKFDEIVDFAEVGRFIDTPIKRYSSGMHTRLAFAVAAHLEPEILIVDEVLAVGDAEFQKKCLGKMSDVTSEGRTVLFVSHNMAAVQGLCSRVVLLRHGNVIKDGATHHIVNEYLKGVSEITQVSLLERKDRKGTGDIRMASVTLCNEQLEPVSSFCAGQYAVLVCTFENRTGQELRNLDISLGIDNQMGQRVTFLSNEMTGQTFSNVPPHTTSIEIHLDRLALAPGRYHFTLFSKINGIIADWIVNAGFFDVEPGDYYGTGRIPPQTQGDFLINHTFTLGQPTSPHN